MKRRENKVTRPFWSGFETRPRWSGYDRPDQDGLVTLSSLRLCASALKCFSVIFILLFTSCQRHGIDVQNQYISYRDLASYQIDTPDWRKECPDYGQRLLISWDVRDCCCMGELTLRLYLQFGNFEDGLIEQDLIKPRGNYIYELINKDYCEKRGIASYKVEICCDGEPIKTLKHLLWVEKITFNSTTTESEPRPSMP